MTQEPDRALHVQETPSDGFSKTPQGPHHPHLDLVLQTA